MNVEALRDLAADCGNLLRLADKLAPVLEAYGDQRAAIAADLATLGQGGQTGNQNAAKTKGPNDPFVSEPAVTIAEAAARACESCGEPFTPSPRVGDRQRFCSSTCRVRASMARQTKQRQEALGSPPGDDGSDPADPTRPRRSSHSSRQRAPTRRQSRGGRRRTA